MKIAICFYGQPRRYQQVFNQWKKVVSELNADVFIHTWSGEDREYIIPNFNALISDLNPKELKISSPYKFKSFIPPNSVYENQSFHSINQAYTISECFNLLQHYQTTFNIAYDVIIKTRFDIILDDISTFVTFIKNKIESNKLYVANAPWQGQMYFDDNIMVAKNHLLKEIFLPYFQYTIDFISQTNTIPGGEQNLFRWINNLNMGGLISRDYQLDFKLIHLDPNNMILNQNNLIKK